ncbi:MAG: aor 11 [Chloroflexi bacterium]|nr:aor 11 [Chloroflexota bacterium]
MVSCYAGKILFVDLTTGRLEEESPSENLYRQFIGGTGLGARVLYERLQPKSDPLGPGNILGFVTGPLTATPTPGSGRFTVVTRSPLTGGWADSNSGGFWGPELKWAGYDAVFVTGASPRPVYLFISRGKAEIRDASKLWGKDTNETDDIIQNETGGVNARVACIGPGGEACSLLAGIVVEKGRIAARAGVGAVMGSKKLKAVVVKGDKGKIKVAQPEKFKGISEAFARKIRESNFHQSMGVTGTGGGTSFLVSIGNCPIKNWNKYGTEAMPTCTNLNSPNMDKYKLRRYGCQACTIRCGAILEVKGGPFATQDEVHRPEYETLAALGTLCFNDNLESVIKANEICNLYGLDTMGVGNVIAFAMECYEKGLISRQETGGIDLTWGNAEAIVALTGKIARREGFGAVLADGAARAAKAIGKGSEDYAMHVGGHRMPYHDPRITPSRGASYFADAQPACHSDTDGTDLLEHGQDLGSYPALKSPKLAFYGDYDKKGPMYVTGAAYFQLFSSAGLCSIYTSLISAEVAELIAPAAGWDFDWEEGLRVGRRILTLRQAFNAREGLRPEMFKLPARLTGPHSMGPAKGMLIDFDMLKRAYFESMGWDLQTGRPGQETLVDLELDALCRDI